MEAHNPTPENRDTISKILKERKVSKLSSNENNVAAAVPEDQKKREEIKEKNRQKDIEMKTKMQVLQEKIK